MNEFSCKHHFLALDKNIAKNAKKVSLVLWITVATMLFEIYYGYKTGSMSLLADGWHMATHAAALGVTYITYRLATHEKMARHFNFGGGKIIALGGFTSSLFLLMVIGFIVVEAVQRLLNPKSIAFDEALGVAIIGLVINLICAYILRDSHAHGGHTHDHNHGHVHDHKHEHSHGHSHADEHSHGHSHEQDHNIRGAYLHVLADAFTSVAAIFALIAGKYYGIAFLDPIIGLIAAAVILKWSIGLIRDTGWELLDGHASGLNYAKLKKRVEEKAQIIDLHVWKIAPHFLACELIVKAHPKLGLEFYRNILQNEFHIQHTVIEER